MATASSRSIPVATTRKELREALIEKRHSLDATIGFVPTMGALHEGHGALLRESKRRGHFTVLSIFVNPKQFGANEDFSKYPRTFSTDLKLAEEFGCDLVFAPTLNEIYPQPFYSAVTVSSSMTGVLCGAHRGGHFDGVTTVVLLLLNLVQAHEVFMGLKDFQQVAIVKKMCADLGHATQVIDVPTVRGPGGLALSSRNRYLSAAEAEMALTIPQALSKVAQKYLAGDSSRDSLLQLAP